MAPTGKHESFSPPEKSRENASFHQVDVNYDQPSWCYSQAQKRTVSRTYSGYITYVHGAESARLRGRLAAVVNDLLQWAELERASKNLRTTDQYGDA